MLSFRKPTGFRLSAAVEFYRGFTPGSGMAAGLLAMNEVFGNCFHVDAAEVKAEPGAR